MTNQFSCNNLDSVKEMYNPTFNDSLQALFTDIKFSPLHTDAEEAELHDISTNPAREPYSLNQLNNTLYSWLQEVQRLEGTCKSDRVIKKDIFSIRHRMLQDGLLSEAEYNDLVYTSNLFIKIHQLVSKYIPSLHKRDILTNLLELYDMKRIDKSALIELCINL